MGETTLFTTWEKKSYYWMPPNQTLMLGADFEQLKLDNITCMRTARGWQITLTFSRLAERGDCLNRVTVNGLEVPYLNYSANGEVANTLSTDLVYQGTYIDGSNTRNVNVWISDRLDYKAGSSVLVRIKSLGECVYNEVV